MEDPSVTEGIVRSMSASFAGVAYIIKQKHLQSLSNFFIALLYKPDKEALAIPEAKKSQVIFG